MRNGPIPAFPHSSDLEQYTVHRITIRSDGKDPISVSGKQVSPFRYTHTIKIFRITMHPRGDVSAFSIRSGFGPVRKWIFLRNRTRGATVIQFMRRTAPRGDRHTVHAKNRTPGVTVIQFMRRMKTPGDQPRELLFLSKRRKGLTHPLRQSLSLTRIPADYRLGKYPC